MECQEYLIFLFCSGSSKSRCVLLLSYILVWKPLFRGSEGTCGYCPGQCRPGVYWSPPPCARPQAHSTHFCCLLEPRGQWVWRLGLAWRAGQAGPDLEECLRPSQESRECQARHLDVIVLSSANGLPAPSPRPDQAPSLPLVLERSSLWVLTRGRRGLPR